MFQLAVYGKGGIGKSTMAANISLAMAEEGLKVMQVGCDPKHDSTRLLLGGRTQQTVLDYVRDVPIGRRKLEDLIETGAGGVLCTEAGGPEPGIGCAGRGILTTFDTLRKLGADDLEVDVKLYDVLGDVVCGGFAVPLRGEYADAVILVTSGEFMALYAANNIMRGLRNFDTGKPRLLGIVLNCRGVEDESATVARFAEATGTRVIAEVPRDRLFAEAEGAGHTVMELYPDSDAASSLRVIASAVRDAISGDLPLTDPTPLDDLQMSDLAAGREIRPPSGAEPKRTGCAGCRRTTIKGTKIMISCAAYGAVAALSRVGGTAVIIHGPASCAYLMETTHAKAILNLYATGVFPSAPENNVRCTMMDDSAAVFGGNAFLSASLRRAIGDGYTSIAVVTTCMPGIIGDDCLSAIDAAKRENPGVRISLIQTDGDIAGEYNDGFLMAAEAIADTIDTTIQPEEGLVNLVASSFFDLQSHDHIRALDGMLGAFGMRINCKFLDDASPAPVREFCRAGVDLLVNDSVGSRELMGVITRKTGRQPFPAALPVGIRDYVAWVRAMGAHTGKEGMAEAEVARAEADYRRLVEEHRPLMEGRRAIVMWKMGSSPDWLLDTLADLGVEVPRVGFFMNVRKKRVRPQSRHDFVEDYTDEMFQRDLEELKPDLVICDLVKPVPPGVAFARLSKIGVGYRSVFEYVRYLEDISRLPAVEGWRCAP